MGGRLMVRQGRGGSRLVVAVLLGLAALSAPSAAGATLGREEQLGRRFDLVARARLPIIDEPDVREYVAAVGMRIVEGLGRQPFSYHFAVVRDGQMNAFAVPGGFVYVHSGLILRAANEDELAGVLAHEVAHVHAHHLVRQQEKSRVLSYTTLLGLIVSAIQPAAGVGAAAASAALQLKYRREFEEEADFLGLRYMQAAGFDGRGMLTFLKKLWAEQRLSAAAAAPFLMMHPLTEERIGKLERVLGTLEWEAAPPRPATAALERVQAILAASEGDGSVERYRRAAKQHPTDPTAAHLLGLVLLLQGRVEEARPYLERAAAAGRSGAQRDLGRALMAAGDLGAARSMLARYVAAHPRDAAGQAELARALAQAGELSAAAEAYHKAVELDPDFAAAHRALGMVLGRLGREGEGRYHLGRASCLGGNLQQALSEYERARDLLPPGSPRREEILADIEELSQVREESRRRAGRWQSGRLPR